MNGEEIVTAGSMTFQTVQQINQRIGMCNLFIEISSIQVQQVVECF
jgi:hypothetical protein